MMALPPTQQATSRQKTTTDGLQAETLAKVGLRIKQRIWYTNRSFTKKTTASQLLIKAT